MSLLQTKNLSAFYGDFQALFGIDVTVGEGETIAVIGANGAGKTTSRSVDAARTTWFCSASPWFRRAAGCFPA